MFARVSTYKTGPDNTTNAPSEEIVNRVLAMPGCRGMYFLNSDEAGMGLSITLWDTQDSIAASREAANVVRADASTAQGLQIVSVEEFEVTTDVLQD